MKLLFICNQNKNRSRTAEDLFKGRFETRSAGLYNDFPLTESQLSWADIIITMEDSQRSEIANRFPKQYLRKQILSLGVPDMYQYNQEELISLLKSKMEGLF